MSWISILFFSLALFVCTTMLRKGADVLSPARVFVLTWSIVLGLADLKLSHLQTAWSALDWAIVLLGPLAFLLGNFVVYVLNADRPLRSLNETREEVRGKPVHENRLFLLSIMAFVTYLFGYVVIYLVKGNLPLFASDPGRARVNFFIFGIGLFLHNIPVILFFAIVYHLVTKGKVGRKWIVKWIALVTIFTYVFLLQRYQLIMVCAMAFTTLYYTTHWIRARAVMLFAALAAFVMYFIATIRAGDLFRIALHKSSLMKIPYKYAAFTEPYMYIAMNVENFVHAANKLQVHAYGFYTFNFVLSLTGLKHPLQEYFGFVDTPFLFSGYNTYTLFWTYYYDFGILGLSLIPFLLGFFVGTYYYSMRRNPTIQTVSFYSVIVFVMALSFFINLLGYLWFVYIIAWFVVILKFMKPRDQHQTFGNLSSWPNAR